MFKAANAFEPIFIQQASETLWVLISPPYIVDESQWLKELLEHAKPSAQEKASTASRAIRLVDQVRERTDAVHVINALLQQYSLDTRKDILLTCLAEALIRIPDAETTNARIRDKISVEDQESHLSKSDSLLVNASTQGLLLTVKIVGLDNKMDDSPSGVTHHLVSKMGEPIIRHAVNQAMKIMGKHFIWGRTIEQVLKNGRKPREEAIPILLIGQMNPL